MTQENDFELLKDLGFELVNSTPDVLVTKLEPMGPEPDDGRYLDLRLNDERCLALQRIGVIVNVEVRGIRSSKQSRNDVKPHLFIEVRRHKPIPTDSVSS